MSDDRTANSMQDRTGEGDRLAEAAGSVASQAARTAQAGLGNGLERVGETLDQFASSIRTAGDQMQDQPQIAGVVDQAAEQVERASQYLRTSNVQGIVHDAENFARRQPVIFLGGALAIGWFAGRFLTSSSTTNDRGRFGRGADRSRPGWWYDAGYGTGTGAESTRTTGSGSTGSRPNDPAWTPIERWSETEGSNRAGA
jgi:hypothetical protein